MDKQRYAGGTAQAATGGGGGLGATRANPTFVDRVSSVVARLNDASEHLNSILNRIRGPQPEAVGENEKGPQPPPTLHSAVTRAERVLEDIERQIRELGETF